MENVHLPKFPQLKRDMKVDVLIVGGGLAGLLCAYSLEKQGVDYALIEADRIMGGVSGYTTAKITSQHGLIYEKLTRKFGTEAARMYWEANEKALGALRDLARKADCDFEQKDHFVYSVDAPQKLEAEMNALQKAGIPAKWSSAPKLPFPVAGAIRFPDQGQFHPLKFAASIAKGLRIFENTKAQEFVGNTVKTQHGSICAEKIIVATHFPILNKHGAFYLKQYQQRSYVLALKDAAQLDGMYLDAEKGGLSLRNAGEALLLGGGSHRTGKKSTAWAPLRQAAERYYPASREIGCWATQDCITLDAMPYIGSYSRKTSNLYVATGFNKWGMTSSMLSAMILADLVQEKKNDYAPLFDPSRSILQPQLLCNAAEAVCNLLTPTVPRCPHLGCALKWNAQERTWDCPCHGSRFQEDGKLINNPATDDMKQK